MSLSRRLEPEESRQVRARLEKRWDIRDGFGSPTRSRSRRASVEKFHEEAFDDLVPVIQLALGSRGISSVLELHDDPELDRELELSLLAPDRVLWTDNTSDWLVHYYHREFPITIAGASLLWDIKEVWPDWRDWRAA